MARRKLSPEEQQYRTSVGMPRAQHALLQALGRQRKRSVSFLICEAVEHYLTSLGFGDAPERAAS